MPEKTKRNPWIWISALLAVAAVGLLVWALDSRSTADDKDDELATTQQQLASANTQLDETEDELETTSQQLEEYEADVNEPDKTGRRTVFTVATFTTMKQLYDDLSKELGATQGDLDSTQEDLDKAKDQADEAEKDAAAAKKKAAEADNETDKAKAEADQAEAEKDAAQSKATIAIDCARAYVVAFGGLFDGDDPSEQAPAVRKEIEQISEDCQAALAAE